VTSTEVLTATGLRRRRRDLHRADEGRRLEQAIGARRGLALHGMGRAWINGREVGGEDPRYTHLSETHD
jgi:hypothetical protein